MIGDVFPLAILLRFINELVERCTKKFDDVGFLRLQRPPAAGLTHEVIPGAGAVDRDAALPAWGREGAERIGG